MKNPVDLQGGQGRRSILRNGIAAIGGFFLGSLASARPVKAQENERPSLSELLDRIAVLENDFSNLQAQVGNVFVRWGSTVAPPGSELVYSGIGAADHISHQSCLQPFVIAPPGEGHPVSNLGGLAYSMVTSSSPLPGIAANKLVQAAVCVTPGPTTVVWGTHTAPPGWTILYRGWAMSGFYQHSGGPIGPICVDNEAFDDSVAFNGNLRALLYPVEARTGNGVTPGVALACAVITKLP